MPCRVCLLDALGVCRGACLGAGRRADAAWLGCCRAGAGGCRAGCCRAAEAPAPGGCALERAAHSARDFRTAAWLHRWVDMGDPAAAAAALGRAAPPAYTLRYADGVRIEVSDISFAENTRQLRAFREDPEGAPAEAAGDLMVLSAAERPVPGAAVRVLATVRGPIPDGGLSPQQVRADALPPTADEAAAARRRRAAVLAALAQTAAAP